MKENRRLRGEQFRKAYHDKSADVIIIPSRKDLGLDSGPKNELVAPYCRVSTLSEMQVESFVTQEERYKELVAKYPNWTLVDIYADEGISATSMKNRKDFLRMIEDCKQGKITRIITKSVSRFARNVVDAISTVRMLRALPTPVGVFFETEQIDTLSQESDIHLSLLASFAESESLNRSVSIKWAIRNRFANNIPRICDLYGFKRTGRELEKDPVESKVVAYMYDLFLDGYTPVDIAGHLTSIGVPTPSEKNTVWSSASVTYILSNEKNCGDVAMQKTVRVDVFSHKSVRNTGEERRYLIRNHHEPIVSRDKWERTQGKLGTFLLSELIIRQEEYGMVIGDLEFFALDAKKGSDFK